MERAARKGRKMRGHWPDGLTLTATWDDFDEWFDDHFGQVFDFDENMIGASKAEVRAHAEHSFWEGCERVEWIGVPPRALPKG